MMIRMRTAVAGLCAVAAVAIGANALAANGDKSTTTSAASDSGKVMFTRGNPPSKADMEKMRKEMEAKREEYEKALADKLGISVEKLQAAEDAVFKDQLDKQVSDGDLTQDQADAILKCKTDPDNCDPSKLPHPKGGPGKGGPGFGFHPGGPGPGGPPPPPSGSQRSR